MSSCFFFYLQTPSVHSGTCSALTARDGCCFPWGSAPKTFCSQVAKHTNYYHIAVWVEVWECLSTSTLVWTEEQFGWLWRSSDPSLVPPWWIFLSPHQKRILNYPFKRALYRNTSSYKTRYKLISLRHEFHSSVYPAIRPTSYRVVKDWSPSRLTLGESQGRWQHRQTFES